MQLARRICMTKPMDQQVEVAKVGLFEDLPQSSVAEHSQHAQAVLAIKRSEGEARLLQPNRLQVELRASNLESLSQLGFEESAERR